MAGNEDEREKKARHDFLVPGVSLLNQSNVGSLSRQPKVMSPFIL